MQPPFRWMQGMGLTPVSESPVRVVGIDLGTTVSTLTEIVWDPSSGEPPVATLREIPQKLWGGGEKSFDLVPSEVAIIDNETFIGTGAARLWSNPQAQLQPGKTSWAKTKNFIGTRKTYPAAPEGFQTPKDIAAVVLRFLNEAALLDDPMPIARVVVTVPASFQLTQRQDTLDAAAQAGLALLPGDLLDEPVAAFLDYMVQFTGDITQGKTTQRILVVDFGGGTCDVALLQLKKQPDGGFLLSRKGVSRFHRIGGSDIDDVIAHDILFPQFLEQNGLDALEFKYAEKSRSILPRLARTAESLKKKLSDAINHKMALGNFDPDVDDLQVSLPAPVQIQTGNAEHPVLSLATPTLSLRELRQATAAFLSPTAVAPKESEYTLATSIFAPIYDVLHRAEWTREHIDQVLIVGGSSLYFGVPHAIKSYFSNSTILTYGDDLDFQRCVGRGAAYQALLLAIYGESPLRAAVAEELTISTNAGPVVIAPANSPLPFPGTDGWHEVSGLKIASGSAESPTSLMVSLKSGNRNLHSQPFEIPPPVATGTPITLSVRIDENQRLELRFKVDSLPPTTGEFVLDNPFSVVANPNQTRDEIAQLEEQVPAAAAETQRRLIRKLAELHKSLGEYERARHYYEGLVTLASTKAERSSDLNALAIICGLLRDHEQEMAHYRQAIEAGASGAPVFNLALSLHTAGRNREALEIVDTQIDQGAARPSDWSLRADINQALGNDAEALVDARECVARCPNVKDLNRFQLNWLMSAAQMLGDENLVAEILKVLNETPDGAGVSIEPISGPQLPDWDA